MDVDSDICSFTSSDLRGLFGDSDSSVGAPLMQAGADAAMHGGGAADADLEPPLIEPLLNDLAANPVVIFPPEGDASRRLLKHLTCPGKEAATLAVAEALTQAAAGVCAASTRPPWACAAPQSAPTHCSSPQLLANLLANHRNLLL